MSCRAECRKENEGKDEALQYRDRQFCIELLLFFKSYKLLQASVSVVVAAVLQLKGRGQV